MQPAAVVEHQSGCDGYDAVLFADDGTIDAALVIVA